MQGLRQFAKVFDRVHDRVKNARPGRIAALKRRKATVDAPRREDTFRDLGASLSPIAHK
jgi:hypothetical protein